MEPSVLGDNSLDLDLARLWVIGLARKSRKTRFDLGGCGWTVGRNEGEEAGCGLDPDEESGGG